MGQKQEPDFLVPFGFYQMLAPLHLTVRTAPTRQFGFLPGEYEWCAPKFLLLPHRSCLSKLLIVVIKEKKEKRKKKKEKEKRKKKKEKRKKKKEKKKEKKTRKKEQESTFNFFYLIECISWNDRYG